MLNKDPKERYSAKESLEHDFFTYIPEETNLVHIIQNIKSFDAL